MTKRGTKSRKPARKRMAKAAYVERRRKRVYELYVDQHMEPRDIALQLVHDGTIETTDESLESAIRIVRKDVAEIRSRLTSERDLDSDRTVALTEIDALELELKHLRKERDRQLVIADGEPTEMCARSRYELAACANPACMAEGKHIPFVGPAIGITITDTPQGPMTSFKALWPAGVRQKASKDAATLTQKISKLESELAEKKRAVQPAKEGDKPGAAKPFEFVFSGKPMEMLIEMNVVAGKVN